MQNLNPEPRTIRDACALPMQCGVVSCLWGCWLIHQCWALNALPHISWWTTIRLPWKNLTSLSEEDLYIRSHLTQAWLSSQTDHAKGCPYARRERSISWRCTYLYSCKSIDAAGQLKIFVKPIEWEFDKFYLSKAWLCGQVQQSQSKAFDILSMKRQ